MFSFAFHGGKSTSASTTYFHLFEVSLSATMSWSFSKGFKCVQLFYTEIWCLFWRRAFFQNSQFSVMRWVTSPWWAESPARPSSAIKKVNKTALKTQFIFQKNSKNSKNWKIICVDVILQNPGLCLLRECARAQGYPDFGDVNCPAPWTNWAKWFGAISNGTKSRLLL